MADSITRPPTLADLARAIDTTNAIERQLAPVIAVFIGIIILGAVGSGFAMVSATSNALFPNAPSAGQTFSTVTLIVSMCLVGAGVVGLLVCVIINGVRQRRLSIIGKQTELAELPVNDLFQGDVLGAWSVVDSDADSLHVTLPGTQFQALAKRLGALVLAVVLVSGAGVAIYAAFAPAPTSTPTAAGTSATGTSTPAPKKKSSKTSTGFSMIKGMIWAFVGALWLLRWSLKPVAFQWLLTNGDDGPRIEIHRLRLFRRTDIASIPAGGIVGFTLVDRRLSLVQADQPIEIAAVSTGPLGRWQAACIATALMARLDPTRHVSLTISGKQQPRPGSFAVPAQLAESCPFAVTTAPQSVPAEFLTPVQKAPPEPASPASSAPKQ